MGKKSSGTKYVSKGQRRSVARSTTKLVRAGRTDMDRAMFALEAYNNGKSPKKFGFENMPDPRFNRFKMQ